MSTVDSYSLPADAYPDHAARQGGDPTEGLVAQVDDASRAEQAAIADHDVHPFAVCEVLNTDDGTERQPRVRGAEALRFRVPGRSTGRRPAIAHASGEAGTDGD